MEIALSPEQEFRLLQIAQHEGMNVGEYIFSCALHSVDEDARFRSSVEKGIRQANAGEFLDEEEMDTRLERMLQR